MRRLTPALFVTPALVAIVLSVGAPRLRSNQSHPAIVPSRAVIYPPELAPFLTLGEGSSRIAGASRIARESAEELEAVYPSVRSIPVLSQGVGPEDLESLLIVHPDASVVWANDVPLLARLGLQQEVGLGFAPDDLGGSFQRVWHSFGQLSG